jgi:hypothetical protein
MTALMLAPCRFQHMAADAFPGRQDVVGDDGEPHDVRLMSSAS